MAYRAVSPNKDRIAKISEQLDHIQQNGYQEKSIRIDQAETKVHVMDENINALQDTLEKKYQGLKDLINKLQRQVEDERIRKDADNEVKQKEIEALDQNLSGIIDQQIFQRKDAENRLVRIIDDKFNLIRNEIQRESKQRNDQIDNLNQSLEVFNIYLKQTLPKYGEQIKQQQVEREDVDQNIMKKTTEELFKLGNTISEEKRIREQNEQIIFDSFKEIVNKVNSQLQEERQVRESTEETMLQLLEDICNKINAASLA